MNGKVWSAGILIVVTVATLTLDAQRGRGAAPPGGARGGGPGGGARTGTIERITVPSKSLEGNLEGDASTRNVTVYLPPSYATDQARRFPVVYLLHGFGDGDNAFTERISRLVESADRLAGAQGFSSPIVVTPDAQTLHGNSLYSSSPATGDWEKFIAEELVAAIDGKYRTYAQRMSRGIGGHGAGGYGALRIGMKYPRVFSSLYAMSPCCTSAADAALDQAATAAEAITTREQAEAAARKAPSGASLALAAAAAWSPNPKAGPLFLDLPVKGGAPRADIKARWAANAALPLVEQNAAGLKAYYSVAMDVGKQDPSLAATRQLHEAMVRLRIPHYYEEYDGDQTSKIRERLERNVLTFFSTYLVAPANPSSPQIKD